MAFFYVLEIMLATAIPALLFLPRVRQSRPGVFWCSLSAMAGVVLYRCDVSLFAIDWGGASYVPALTELLVMFGIIAGSMLVFLFLIENLDIYGSQDELVKRRKSEGAVATIRPASSGWVGGPWVDAPRRYSLIAVLAASVAMGLLAGRTIWGADSRTSPVLGPRTVTGLSTERSGGSGHDYYFAVLKESASTDAQPLELLMIDGNRDGRFVLFPHENHKRKLGDEHSCVTCHHQNMPFDTNTSCHECHRDMYEVTDIFEHAFHVDKLPGDSGCARCHADDSVVKVRQTATACADCHTDMFVAGSRIETSEEEATGFAPAYMDVLHELCIGCHQERSAQEPQALGDAFARCDGCHGVMDGSNLLTFGPYTRPPVLSTAKEGCNALEGYQKLGAYRGL